MKKKYSFLLDIAIICFCICAIAIGVYSAKSAQLNISGSIGFVVHSCELDVKISKQGYGNPEDLTQYETEEQYVDFDPTEGTNTTGKLGGQDATIKGPVNLGSMNFTDLATNTIPPIIVKITVTNQSDFQVSGFVMVDVPENSNITYTRQHSLGSSTTLNDHSSALILNKKASATFVITFKVGAPDQAIDPSKAIKITGDFAKYDSTKLTAFNDTTNNLTYTVNKSDYASYAVTTLSKDVANVDILSSINHLPVTQIASSAFKSDTTITSIKIPDTVVTINNSAFDGCTNLSSVKMSDVTKTIGSKAFYNCSSLTEITIPSSVKTINSYAFYNCTAIEKVNTPSLESWINIEFYNDYGVNPTDHAGDLHINNVLLTKVTFPETITKINNRTFSNCKSLTGELSIPDSVTSIGSRAFFKCSGLTGELVIPDSVTNIGNDAFYQCSGFNGGLTIGNKVTSIGSSAFYDCINLTGGLEIPESVTKIANSAFFNCRCLTGNLVIPNGVTNIGNSAFGGCGFNGTLTIPDSVTNIGESAFSGCDITGDIIIPDSVTYLGGSAFSHCDGITSVSISNQVKTIYSSTFNECNSLMTVVIPNSVTKIESSAFYGCGKLRDVTIPSSVTSIGTQAFVGCCRLVEPINQSSLVINPGDTTNGYLGKNALKVITDKSQSKITIDDGYVIYDGNTLVDYVGNEQILTLPDCITKINQYAFYENYNIIKVTIPKDVAEIGNYAFEYCSRLVEVVDNSTALSISKGSNSNGYVAYYAKQVITDEKNSKIKIEDKYIFYENDLTSKTLMEYTGNESQIILPSDVTEIAPYVFGGNNNLISITLPQNLTTIGSYAFNNCINLKQIVIPNNVKTIGNYSFSYCYKLNDATIGSSVTSLGQYAFAICYNLIDIVIPNSVSSIGDYSFQQCDKLKTVSFGTGFSKMGNNAFYDCNELEEVTFNRATPPTFAYSAFTNCSKLTKIYVPNESAVTAYKNASNLSSHYNKIQVKQEA